MSPWVDENEGGKKYSKKFPRGHRRERDEKKEGGGREGKIRGIEINKNRESNFSSEFI